MPRLQVCYAKCDRLGVVEDLDRGVATIGGDDDSRVTALWGWQRIFTSVTADARQVDAGRVIGRGEQQRSRRRDGVRRRAGLGGKSGMGKIAYRSCSSQTLPRSSPRS
jgi:hypothetical protein